MKKIFAAVGVVALTGLTLGVPTPASAAQPSDCSGKQTFFQFTYKDGATDSGCADKNEVTPAQNPGQLAPELHVSCSDSFDSEGRAKKSILGRNADGSERLVANYLIIKDVSKPNSKTCGDATPIPAGGNAGLLIASGGVAGALGLLGWRRRRQSASIG